MSNQAMTPITSILPASEWTSLAGSLRDFAARAEDLCYVPNFGNAGDALIASGAWQLFDTIGLRPRVICAARVSKGASVIYAGGANLTPYYQDCARFLRRCMTVGVKEVVVLPHTIRGHGELLQQLDERFTLVCRDLPSLEWCTTTARAARTMFSHDLALRLDVRNLQRRCRGLVPFAALIIRAGRARRLRRYLRWRRYSRSVQPVNGTLQVFRTDIEAVPHHPGRSTSRHLGCLCFRILGSRRTRLCGKGSAGHGRTSGRYRYEPTAHRHRGRAPRQARAAYTTILTERFATCISHRSKVAPWLALTESKHFQRERR